MKPNTFSFSKRFYLEALFASALVFLSVASASAQTFTPIRNLDFGSMVAGVSKHVLYSDGTAGEFSIQVPKARKGTFLTLAWLTFFPLPSSLSDGSNDLPITFGATDAAWSNHSNVAGATLFDPASPLGAYWHWTNSPKDIYVWIGGTVSPPVGQAAGQYGGTITATFTIVYL